MLARMWELSCIANFPLIPYIQCNEKDEHLDHAHHGWWEVQALQCCGRRVHGVRDGRDNFARIGDKRSRGENCVCVCGVLMYMQDRMSSWYWQQPLLYSSDAYFTLILIELGDLLNLWCCWRDGATLPIEKMACHEKNGLPRPIFADIICPLLQKKKVHVWGTIYSMCLILKWAT